MHPLVTTDFGAVIGEIAAGAAIVTLVASGVGWAVSRIRNAGIRELAVAEAFKATVTGLGSANIVERVANAILIRRFFDPKSEYGRSRRFETDAVDVIAAVLRKETTGNLQKALADGLRSAPTLEEADLQNTNFRGAYLAGVTARRADFYRADLSYASVKGADLRQAVFYQALLFGTVFERADLRGADFFEADLARARFALAKLQGARFVSARNVPHSIAAKVDGEGFYRCPDDDDRVTEPPPAPGPARPRIFVSQPRSVPAPDHVLIALVHKILDDCDVEVETAASTSYSSSSPLHHVGSAVGRCHGAVIIGTPQMEVHQGLANPGSPDAQPVNDVLLPAAWNQIEAGMSAMRNQPLFVVRQGTVGGVFDIVDDGEDVVQFDLDATWDLEEMERRLRNWTLHVKEVARAE